MCRFFKMKGNLTMSTKNITSRKAYRQGELLFVPLNREDMALLNPENQSYPHWEKLASNVIREGEATGHKHQVLTETPDVATLLAPARQFMEGLPNMDLVGSDDRLLVATKPLEITHPEHRPLRLPEGNYLVVIQREYDEVKARRIRD